MSQLGARNGSLLGAPQGSQLGAYGLGFKTFDYLYHEDIQFEFDIDVYAYNQTLNSTAFVGKAGVILGPYFMTTFAIAQSDAGKCEKGAALTQTYDGVPDPANDTVSSNNLTLGPGSTGAGVFSWASWPARGSLTAEPFWEDTGSSMIFRSELLVSGPSTAGPSPEGIITYGHTVALSFTGSWVRSATLEMITLYITGLSGHTVGGGGGGSDVLRLLLRIKATVTA